MPLIDQILHGKRQGLIIILGSHGNLTRFLIRVKPITVGETMCCIVSYYRCKSAAFAKPAFQLNDKFEDVTMFQLELYTQCVVVVQQPMKLNETHPMILPWSAIAAKFGQHQQSA